MNRCCCGLSGCARLRAACILEAGATLAEGPVWDPARRVLWWVDIVNGEVHAFDPEGGRDTRIVLDEMVGAVALRRQGGLVVAAQHGFALLDPETQVLRRLGDPEHHLPGNRFNDGKCDPAGRFWAGTMAFDVAPGKGSLYCLEPDGRIHLKVRGVTISNGLAWDASARTLYYVDSPTYSVAAFDYDRDTGAVTNRRVAFRIPEACGTPDGMTIDREGMLWIAHWGGFNVSRWNPATGDRMAEVHVPVSRVSSCTFGGDRLDRLYITTASENITEAEQAAQPLAGGLFCVEPGVQGYEPHYFEG